MNHYPNKNYNHHKYKNHYPHSPNIIKKHNSNEKKFLSPIIPKKSQNNFESFINDSAFFNSIDFLDEFPLENKNKKNDININEKEKVNFGIKSDDLKELNKAQLKDLIIYIINICSLTLKDKKYIDYIHNIFTLVENMENNCYDIIINKNSNSIQDNKKEYENNKIEDNKNNVSKTKNKFFHYFKFPIYCSFHKNIKFEKMGDYLYHLKMNHNNNEFICFICKEKFSDIKKLRKHFFKINDVYNKNYNKNNKDLEEDLKDNYIEKEDKKENKFIPRENNFISKENYFIEKKSKKNEDEKKLNLFYYDYGDKYFNSKNTKEQFWNNKIDNEMRFYCKICNKPFNSIEEKEKYCIHKNYNMAYICKICNKIFNSKSAKESHCQMKNHF